VVHFNGFLRLVLLGLFLELKEPHPVLETVSVRTNRYLLK
jgi:hypothetical protein